MNIIVSFSKRIRRNFSARQIRFLLSHHILARVPRLNRYFSLYSRFTNLDKLADAELHKEDVVNAFPISHSERKYLNNYAETGAYTLTEDGIRLSYTFSAYGIDRCDVLSQSMTVIQRDSASILLCPDASLNRNIVRPYHYRVVTHQCGTSISMLITPKGHSHYFHFLLDHYIALRYLLERVPESRNATILVRQDLRPFQQAAFDILKQKYPQLSFLRVGIGEKVRCDRLLFPCLAFSDFIELFADATMLKKIGADFRAHYKLNSSQHLDTPTHIVISRKNQKLRRLVNEEALMEQLTRLGFTLVRPEEFTHKQQVALFNSAQYIVATSGAALTNLVFCRPGGVLVELGPDGFHLPFWFALARQIGWQHQVIKCRTLDAHDSHEVDIPKVVDMIRSVLSEKRYEDNH